MRMIKELLAKMDADPWHVKLRRKLRVKVWVFKANLRHYRDWLGSKQYRQSYGDCDCFKGKRAIDDDYCKTNPKCNLRKTKVSYIDV